MTIAQKSRGFLFVNLAITISANFGDAPGKEIGSLQRFIVICSEIEIASFARVIWAWEIVFV
jgi:hypothetical protein